VWSCRGQSTPVVLTSHGTDLFLLDKLPAIRQLAGPVFRAARHVTVVSRPLVPRVTVMGVPAVRVSTVPMPVDDSGEGAVAPVQDDALATLAPVSRDPLLVLFVGRLVERKGVKYAIEAIAQLHGTGLRARLLVIGDGPKRVALESLSCALGVTGAVEFTGRQSARDVAAAYRRATVLVVPSVTDWKGEQEGFGMVIVEAMRAGLPVVATRSGGIPDIIEDGVTGLLVPERDPTALARCIRRVVQAPALAGALRARAVGMAMHRFTPGTIARRFERVYRQAALPHYSNLAGVVAPISRDQLDDFAHA
jgi:glycosyltransferase involved in cell wall biosynthesis